MLQLKFHIIYFILFLLDKILGIENFNQIAYINVEKFFHFIAIVY